MKIEKEPKGHFQVYRIILDGKENPEFREILEGWLDALEYHEYKSQGYKKRDVFSLGIKGEFVGFWRKAQKLLPLVWEAKTLTGEGTQEVLMDTFGSVGLMLQALRKHNDKYSARWRDNHGNKPTFGPSSLEPRWSGINPNKIIIEEEDNRIVIDPETGGPKTSPWGCPATEDWSEHNFEGLGTNCVNCGAPRATKRN